MLYLCSLVPSIYTAVTRKQVWIVQIQHIVSLEVELQYSLVMYNSECQVQYCNVQYVQNEEDLQYSTVYSTVQYLYTVYTGVEVRQSSICKEKVRISFLGREGK